MTTSVTGSESRQDVVVNGDGAHTPTDITNEEPLQTKNNTKHSIVSTSNYTGNERASPQESQQPVASCSGNYMMIP